MDQLGAYSSFVLVVVECSLRACCWILGDFDTLDSLG